VAGDAGTAPAAPARARWRVLVSAPYMRTAIRDYEAMLREHGVEVVVPPVRERLEEAELLEWIGEIDGVICGDDRFTDRVLAAAPRLKVISKWGTGVDAIDREAAARRGIAVCNTPNAFTEPVADTVLGYLLCFSRRLPWMDREIRGGRWEKPQTLALRECTLGIVGVGNIGRAVATRASAFGMRLLGRDPVEPPAAVREATGLTMVELDRLLTESDFVSINCDLNPSSQRLIGDEQLQRMKRTAVLINTARGPIVDEPALVWALEQRWIAGAALDVFEEEPLPGTSPLRRMDNCLFAPHNANSSPEAARRVHENSIRNLLRQLGAIA
jgi:D-3-phosphoglycerate dehydrogenase